jgi:hypothetical protein
VEQRTFTRDDNSAITCPAGRTQRLITTADDGCGHATHRYTSHENDNTIQTNYNTLHLFRGLWREQCSNTEQVAISLWILSPPAVPLMCPGRKLCCWPPSLFVFFERCNRTQRTRSISPRPGTCGGLGQFSSLIRDKNDKKTFYHETPTVRNQNFYCQEFNNNELGYTVFMYLTVY